MWKATHRSMLGGGGVGSGGPARGQAGGRRNWLGTGLMWILKDLVVLLRGSEFLLKPWCTSVGSERMIRTAF